MQAAGNKEVRDYWETSSCGEVYATGQDLRTLLDNQSRRRYELEPYILPFARFAEARGKDVLEVGTGMGADHAQLAQAGPRTLMGVDLTCRAMEWTRERLRGHGLASNLIVSDAERLPFRGDSFDLIYSWGVIHHSSRTEAAVAELYRVLRPGGTLRVMIYHHPSVVGYLLWLRYALLVGRPRRPFAELYSRFLESPGTSAYTLEEARAMFSDFCCVRVWSQLSFADLLLGQVGQSHGCIGLRMLRACWPRELIRRRFSNLGLYLLVDATKCAESLGTAVPHNAVVPADSAVATRDGSQQEGPTRAPS